MVILMVHHSASVIMSFSLYIHLPTSFLRAMWICPMIMKISVAQKNTYLWRGLNIAFWSARSFYHVLWSIKYVQIKNTRYVKAKHIMEHADEIYSRITYDRVLTDRISIHIIQGIIFLHLFTYLFCYNVSHFSESLNMYFVIFCSCCPRGPVL